ncbi:SWIB/MDM2 domain-containing protein [Zopfochytrium polystomum]|nr:SWIB/MDM2 domain-containing protein [Zopfochytrium polystomum]
MGATKTEDGGSDAAAAAAAADPDDKLAALIPDIRDRIRESLRGADLDTVTSRQVRKLLQPQFPHLDLDGELKPAINSVITEVFDALAAEAAAEDDDDEDDDDKDDDDKDDDDDRKAVKKTRGGGDATTTSASRKRPRRSAATASSAGAPKTKKRRVGGGFAIPYYLSPALAAVIAPPDEANTAAASDATPALSRPEVVKRLWAYIKGKDLQDPANRQKILCDGPLRDVFRVDSVGIFRMNKLLSKHLTRVGDATGEGGGGGGGDEDGSDDGDDDDGDDGDSDDGLEDAKAAKKPRKAAKSKAAKSQSKRAGGGGGGGGLQQPLAVSADLAVVVGGSDPISRPQVVKKIWEYVRAHELQDPADRRFINCDQALRAVFGVDRCSSFAMNKYIGKHLTKVE